jgi:IS30 family transposase
MSRLHCIKENRKGKYLNEKERYQLEILLKEKVDKNKISKILDRSIRTIYREIKRGQVKMLNSDLTYRYEYCADTAQKDYDIKATNKGPTLKIGYDHQLAKYIEDKIKKEKYSPDAVIGEIKAKGLKFKNIICTKTLYNYIDKEIFINITNKDLPIKRKGKKRKHKKVRIALNNIKGTSIEERPKAVEEREEYGHWEMDCVVGKRKGAGAVLLVLTERKTRQEIIRKIASKKQEAVIKALNSIERKYDKKFKEKFKTITVDNGSEFLDYKGMEKSIDKKSQRTKIYYAHPYSSWERGSNENNNKLIRRFIPKGVDISKITNKEIKRIEHWINNYPRRIFNYRTANEMVG